MGVPTNLTHRLTLRLNDEDFEKLTYWSEKNNMPVQEFIPVILQLYIDIQNGNFELPTFEQKRINQLVELISVLSQNIQSLESITTSGFESLLQLTRGENYLFNENEDGDL